MAVEATPRPSLRSLAQCYGVSHQALARYAQEGAPVRDVERFAEWLQDNSERLGPLRQLLLDSATRRELERTIRSLSDQTKFDTHR